MQASLASIICGCSLCPAVLHTGHILCLCTLSAAPTTSCRALTLCCVQVERWCALRQLHNHLRGKPQPLLPAAHAYQSLSSSQYPAWQHGYCRACMLPSLVVWLPPRHACSVPAMPSQTYPHLGQGQEPDSLLFCIPTSVLSHRTS